MAVGVWVRVVEPPDRERPDQLSIQVGPRTPGKGVKREELHRNTAVHGGPLFCSAAPPYLPEQTQHSLLRLTTGSSRIWRRLDV